MKEIPLTQYKVAVVDDEDYELVSQFKWHAAKRRNNWYAERWIGGGIQRTQGMHNLIMDAKHVDHINHDGLDNRRSNLRVVTRSQQGANRLKTKGLTSRYKGVRWNRGAWEACIQRRYLGRFDNEDDAARAYNEAASELWGEYANLNEVT